MDNFYDRRSGRWVTAEGRYKAILGSDPEFCALVDGSLDGPHAVWSVLLRLMDAVPDDLLGFVGAGPLEDAVVRWGAELVERIEAQAARDERFREALGCIWLSHGELSAAVLERVIRASGGEIEPLPPLDELERKWPIPPGSLPDQTHAASD